MTTQLSRNGVYLCGPVEQDDNPRTWRDHIKEQYPKIDFIDPMDFQEIWDTDPETVIERELSVCENHPILVYNIGHDAPRTVGTHHEISHALAHDNDKIAVVPKGEVAGFIKHRVRVFESVDAALAYLLGKKPTRIGQTRGDA